MLKITIEHPCWARLDNQKLLDQLDKEILERTPKEYAHLMDVDELARAKATMFIVRDGDKIVACCALIRHNVYAMISGELKRMYVHPEYRNFHLADRIVHVIESVASLEGLGALLVETGPIDSYGPVHVHLKRCGFTQCGPFLDYKESEHSAFFYKMIP